MLPLIGALAAPLLERAVGGIASGVLQKATGGGAPQSTPGNIVEGLASSVLGIASKGISSLL